MKKTITLKIIAATAVTACSSAVFAHDGHGLTGSHWHASDTWGFVVVGMVALGIWLTRGDK